MGIATMTTFDSSYGNTWSDDYPPFTHGFGLAYLVISVLLNVFLTSMVVLWLSRHSRDFQTATGTSDGVYEAIMRMFIESCAIFTVNSVLVIGPSIVGSPLAEIFLPILAQTQVRAFHYPTLGQVV